MEKEIIKTENYLLVVDDSEIKEGDWMYLKYGNTPSTKQGQIARCEIEGILNSFVIWQKVIAHLPINDSADLKGVPLLPPIEEDEEELVDKLFVNEVNSLEKIPNSNALEVLENGFKHGYNKAREKYKFTEEDIAKAVMFGRWGETTKKAYQDFIESLSQPKTPTHFEFEMEDGFSKNNDEYIDELGAKGNYYTHLKVIKTTTNSQGQEVACGKYLFEL